MSDKNSTVLKFPEPTWILLPYWKPSVSLGTEGPMALENVFSVHRI